MRAVIRTVLSAVGSGPPLALLLLPLAAGCSLSITPRENFIDSRNTELGSHLDQISDLARVVGSRPLPNGNREYTYDWSSPGRPCVYVREVDGRTGRVVAWRTEGDDRGCRYVL